MTSKRIRLLIPLALIAISALLAACGGSTESVKVGNETVSIPGNLHTLGEKLRAVLDQQPYEKWAVDCYVKQYEKVIPPAEQEKLESASQSEFAEFITPHLVSIGEACERPGRHLLNPDASADEMESMRAAQAGGLRIALEGSHVPDDEIDCFEEEFEQLPVPQVIVTIEGTETQRDAIYHRLALTCEES